MLVDRGSTDQTVSISERVLAENSELKSKTTIIESDPVAYLKGTYDGLSKCDEESIAVLMDGNSEFLSENVLSILQEQYLKNKKVRTVYSSSFSLDSATNSIKQERVDEYDESENFMLLYRFNPKKFASLFTFRTGAMYRINEAHLSKNGMWYDSTRNDALVFSVLETTCGNTGVIKRPLLLQQKDSDFESKHVK